MRRLLPPTHLLRAFLTVAEHGSVARAAEALHLTPSAVSKQISELEKWLGVTLFERVRKRLALTPSAQGYREALLPVLKQLEAATLGAMQSGGREHMLRIAALPGVRQKWLDPKLTEFALLYPQIELCFSPFSQSDVITPDSALDGVIRYGRDGAHATRCDYLAGNRVVLIAPPAALMAQPLTTHDDVRHHLLIHAAAEHDGWARWCQLHRLRGIDTLTGPRLTLLPSIINAVSSGVGLALLPLFLVAEDIASGTVSAPFAADHHEGGGYYFCTYAPAADPFALETFRGWLLDVAEATQREF